MTSCRPPEASRPGSQLERSRSPTTRRVGLDQTVTVGPVRVDTIRPEAVLRSKKPATVEQELYAMLCVYQAVRDLIGDAAPSGLDPGRVSFSKAIDAARDTTLAALSPHGHHRRARQRNRLAHQQGEPGPPTTWRVLTASPQTRRLQPLPETTRRHTRRPPRHPHHQDSPTPARP